jgi:RimJ/RimL family protein N-acetyltransferase
MQDDGSEDDLEGEESQLQTQRLVLRPPRRSDVAALTAALDNARVSMALGKVPYPYRRSDAEIWIERERARCSTSGATYIAVSHAEGCLIGSGSHSRSDSWPDGFELHFWIAEPFWGRGYGTEVAHAIIDNAFVKGGAERIWCAIRVNSASARRVVEKCGFQFRDTGMIRSIAARGAVPIERFVLERRIWSSLKSWGAEGLVRRDMNEAVEDDDESHAA